MSLDGKVIVISGGSRGVGGAIAKVLAENGGILWLLARTRKELVKTVKSIVSSGGQAFYCTCDVSSATQVGECVNSVLDRSGRIDVLINNAGIWVEGETTAISAERIERVFRVNSIGAIYLTRAILPAMRERRDGHVINIVSLAGIEPSSQWGVYAASKYALRGFAESLRLEVEAEGIKVTSLYPGGIDTGMYRLAGYPDKVHEPWMMSKDVLADVVLFVLTRPSDVLIDQVVIRKFT